MPCSKVVVYLQRQTNQNNNKMTYINRDFRIKVNGINNEGKKINTLVGVSGAIELIGEDFLEKFVDRAYAAGLDACTCKLRRGIKVTLYIK